MSKSENSLLRRKLEREKLARKQSEKILEQKSAELFIRTEELNTANEKLEKLLVEKSSQLQGIFENIIDAYVVMDLEGNVLKMNGAASQLFGIDIKQEPLNVSGLIYPDDVEYAFNSFKTLISKGYFTNYQARVRTRYNGVRWVQINASLVYDNQNQPLAAQGIVRDITEQLNKTNALAFISQVAQEILGQNSFEAIGTILAQKVSAYLGTEDCIVYLLKEEKKQLEQISAVGAKLNQKGAIINPIVIPLGSGIVGSVAQTGKEEIISDTSKDPRYIVDDAARLSELTVPISVDQQVLGVIDAEHEKAHFFTREQLSTVKAVSNLVALQLRSAMDVSARKQSEARNLRLLEKLERSNRELSEYAHMVSHDLKSPLRSISALVDWIREDNLDKLTQESQGHFKLLEETVQKMEALISDILVYASAGKANGNKSLVNINQLINSISELIYMPDNVQLEIPKPLPSLYGEPIQLQQLFQNLIVNAIKYNDKSSGYVRIECEQHQDYYQFTVADNGMGIAPEYHEKIFKIFQSLNPDKESSGLGLALVQKVVHSHQGQIWVSSELGVGASFHFTLKKTHDI